MAVRILVLLLWILPKAYRACGVWKDGSIGRFFGRDLKKLTDGWSIANRSIDGLAKRDSDGHSPRQMQAKKVVRVLDHEEGSASRRWAALDFGVIVESHVDHLWIR